MRFRQRRVLFATGLGRVARHRPRTASRLRRLLPTSRSLKLERLLDDVHLSYAPRGSPVVPAVRAVVGAHVQKLHLPREIARGLAGYRRQISLRPSTHESHAEVQRVLPVAVRRGGDVSRWTAWASGRRPPTGFGRGKQAQPNAATGRRRRLSRRVRPRLNGYGRAGDQPASDGRVTWRCVRRHCWPCSPRWPAAWRYWRLGAPAARLVLDDRRVAGRDLRGGAAVVAGGSTSAGALTRRSPSVGRCRIWRLAAAYYLVLVPIGPVVAPPREGVRRWMPGAAPVRRELLGRSTTGRWAIVRR